MAVTIIYNQRLPYPADYQNPPYQDYNAAIESVEEMSCYQLENMYRRLNLDDWYIQCIFGTTYREFHEDDLYTEYGWACAYINAWLENYNPAWRDKDTLYNIMAGWGAGYYSETNVMNGYYHVKNDTDAYAVNIRKSLYLAVICRDRNIFASAGPYYDTSVVESVYMSPLYDQPHTYNNTIQVWKMINSNHLDSDYKTFTVRTSSPVGTNNPYYMSMGSNQSDYAHYKNPCIIAQSDHIGPMAGATALPNCTGYLTGRWMEVYAELTGDPINSNADNPYNMYGPYGGQPYPPPGLDHVGDQGYNASHFWQIAEMYNFGRSQDPVPGAGIVWGEYDTADNPKAGHVGFVEQVIDNDHIITTESGFDSPGYIWVSRDRYRNSGSAMWGCDAPYFFKGFVYPIVGGGSGGGDNPIPPSPVNPPSGIGKHNNDWWQYMKRRYKLV